MRRTIRIVILTMFVLGAPTAAAFAQPPLGATLHFGASSRPTMDIGYFYDDLAPYGYWMDRPQYGWVWTPRAVESSWRPYEDGHWALTDDGWTWISDEPFGWATDHYGNWYSDPVYGWSWIPGDEWAPARVSWRESNDYIGWAPLPPRGVDLLPASFVFVPARSFLAPDIMVSAVPLVQSVEIFPRTRTLTTYRMVNRRFVNFGVPVERVQRLIGRPVPRYQVVDLSPDFRHRGARIDRNRLALFRPQVTRVRVAPPPARSVARGSLMTPRIAASLKANRGRHLALGHTRPPGIGVARVHQREFDRRETVARRIAAPGRDLRSHGGRKLEARHGGRSLVGPVRHQTPSQGRHMVKQRTRISPHRPTMHVTQRSHGGRQMHVTQRSHGGRSAVRQHSARPPRVHVQRQMSRHGGGGGGRAFHGGGGRAGGGGGHGRGGRRPPV